MNLLKKYWLVLLFAIAIGSVIVINYVSGSQTEENAGAPRIPEEISSSQFVSPDSHETDKDKTKIYVDVKGNVKQPGVYQIDSGKRVSDVIELSGGFLDTAEKNAVNLAQKVHDEMVIIVPEKGEETSQKIPLDPTEEKLRLNGAAEEELTTLTGIGPSKAAAIVQYREENGDFQQMEELLNVSGIGATTLEKIESEILIP
ncbi:helix-hairpin-helix domain-containing protein [Sediminibacillus albus]|uniref:Competence protein ComEA n=1 Tax=Sediminibacillus albus TaxID=407036 RepID=A0A1G9CMT8_9BACI|nr:helix-hairpin-helix domain-containing protein [Sediminibacillus albus]SDK52958.1 competence protein ComEA [Sediminibacillus albus]